MTRLCERCGQPSEGRFCQQCIILAVGPKATSTLLGWAVIDAARDDAKPTVNGMPAPPLPVPNWCVDPVGIEPPLGIDIEALPALGGAGGQGDE
jgi:hypothetical protein